MIFDLGARVERRLTKGGISFLPFITRARVLYQEKLIKSLSTVGCLLAGVFEQVVGNESILTISF